MSVTVDEAYAECERITGEQARNFAWGIRLLPTPKRRALSAVYAMARRIDDIGDGTLPVDRKRTALAEARHVATRPSEHPDDVVAVALADAADRLPVPLDAFGELVDGCEMDVTGRTYGDLDDLVEYCRCVAGSIGRLSLGVFAPELDSARRAEADRLADDLGVALQLTNILRDVREDLLIGRVYLPAKDLELFGVRLAIGADGALDPCDGSLAELVRFESARAWGWYDRGLRLLPMLDRRSAACCGAMAGIYRELLVRIAADPAQMMRERMSLPVRTKLRVAAQSFVPSRVTT
ncbi:isoprenoid biosynthesis enzyme family protein [Jatrophihabitans fulvus]